MFNKIVYENLSDVYRQMTAGGLFLTSKGEKLNTMVIGWGGVNVYYRIPIFIAPVRTSRYTHQLLESSGEFTISVPRKNELRKALGFCGTKSGRDFDKFKECNLTPVHGRSVSVPIIKECYLHFECEIIYNQHMIPENLNEELDSKVYPNNNYHTFYFGKIVNCYTTE